MDGSKTSQVHTRGGSNMLGGLFFLALVNTTIAPLPGDYAVADAANNRIQLCPSANPGGACTTVASGFGRPAGIAFNGNGDYAVVDHYNHRIQLCPSANPGGACTTVAGGNGQGSGLTQLYHPSGLAFDRNGDYLVVDANNNRVQLCPAANPGSACTMVASGFRYPWGIAVYMGPVTTIMTLMWKCLRQL